MGVVTISLRCAVVPVRATVGYGRYVSPIELIVLKALTLDEHDELQEATAYGADQLADMLGLGRRLTLDVVSDLWHKGYVTVDLAHGQVKATAAVRRHSREGTLNHLDGAEQHAATFSLMVDELSGTLLPVGGEERPREGNLQVPVTGSREDEQTFTQSELVDALHETLRRERRDRRERHNLQEKEMGREQQVLTAQIVPPQLRPQASHRWLALTVNVGLDRDSDRIRLSSTDTALPIESRLRVLEKIASRLETAPDDPFARAIRAAADVGYTEPLPLEAALQRFDEAVESLTRAPAGTYHDRHLELADQARRLNDLLRLRVASEVGARVLVDREEHRKALLEVISKASQQLVISCPSIGYEALHELLEPLERALANGVRVVILWGDSHRSTLPPPVFNLLMELRVGAKNRLIWSRRPSRTHACLAVADDRHALVTGYPFLGPPPPRHGRASRSPQNRARQIGSLIEAPSSGPCEPVEALLRWARTAVPDYMEGRRLRTRHSELRPAPTSSEPLPAPWQPDLPELPAAPSAATEGGAPSAGSVDLWHRAWTEYAAALRRELEARTRPWAAALIDGDHRDLLWQALRHARSRLLVSSALIGPDAFDSRVADAVKGRLWSGAEVTLAHGRQSETTGTAEGPRRLLGELRKEFQGRGLSVLTQATNARILVADDDCVVGSFDLLSVGTHSAGSPYRRPTEIGVRIVDGTVAGQLTAAVRGAATGESGPEEPAEEEPLAVPVPERPRAATSAQRLLNALASAPDAADAAATASRIRSAVEELAKEDGPAAVWSLLDTLKGHPDHFPVLRVAAAHAIRHFDGDSTHRRWQRWLMRDRWDSGAYMEAALLRAAMPAEETRPRLRLALAVLLRGGEGLDAAVEYAALGTDEALTQGLPGARAEAAALSTLCVNEILLGRRGTAAAGVLELLHPNLGSPWQQLSELALEHHATGLGPLPMPQIRAERDSARHQSELDAAWELLDRRLERTAAVTFRFVSGIRTHAALFHSAGEFGRLRAPVRSRDTEAVRRWVSEHPVSGIDQLLDDTTRSLESSYQLHVLERGQRRNFVARLSEVVEAAEDVVRLLDAGGSAHAEGLASHLPTARALAGLMAQMSAAADGTDGPERSLVGRLLRELAEPAAWAGREDGHGE
ncbi:hypothetical protein [Actinacidiphila sp. bgisy160]|uniref:hypothetical protein n=1 Tax=Actinacidiphila sp. bgisy160 TaxID=3413796 RepID=UPI003D74D789